MQVLGSVIRKDGDPCFPMRELFYPLDFIPFMEKLGRRITVDFSQEYRRGLSLRQIAKRHGCSKNAVRSSLIKSGITLREPAPQATHLRKVSAGKQCAQPYFGFCYLDGEIVKDPREYPTLSLMHDRWKKKWSAHMIVKELNQKKIPSRKGKLWTWPAVQNILNRFETKQVQL